MITVEKADSVEGAKRQNFPYIFTAECPCGHTIENDYSSGHYLMYPCSGDIEELHFYCNECGEELEETIKVKVGFTLTVVEE